MKSVGVDIGGTKIAAASVLEDGTVVDTLSVPSHPDDPDALIASVADLVETLSDEDTIAHVGVAAAAFFNRDRSHIYFSPNISWSDFPVRAKFESGLGRPVVLENDANAAAWAEYRFGAGQHTSSFIMLTLGTGVGGAIIEDGHILTGAFGAAGELGHLVVERGGLPCGCGRQGCLEQYASGTALMKRVREATGDPSLTSEQAVSMYVSGDSRVTSVFDEVADVLASSLTSIVAFSDPEVVVIGGGVAKAGPPFLSALSQKFLEHHPALPHIPSARIALATLGSLAGAVGAADLARRGEL